MLVVGGGGGGGGDDDERGMISGVRLTFTVSSAWDGGGGKGKGN